MLKGLQLRGIRSIPKFSGVRRVAMYVDESAGFSRKTMDDHGGFSLRSGLHMTPLTSPLTTDLYELNMVQAYLDRGEDKQAVFEFFVRRLPERRGFLLAAGLDDALAYLEALRFSPAEIDWLRSTGRFRDNLLDYLAGFRFTGDVHAIPEGTVCFRTSR